MSQIYKERQGIQEYIQNIFLDFSFNCRNSEQQNHYFVEDTRKIEGQIFYLVNKQYFQLGTESANMPIFADWFMYRDEYWSS